MSTSVAAVLLGVAYVAFFLLERAFPLRRPKARLLPRLTVNIAISAIAFATAALLVQPAALAMLGYTDSRSLGLIPLTLRVNVPQAAVTIGIPGYSGAEDNGLLRCILMPFGAQRDYWCGPRGRRLSRHQP